MRYMEILAFRALQSCYLLLVLYIYAYEFREGIKDLKSTRRQDYDADVFSNLISKLSPNPTGSEKKHPSFWLSLLSDTCSLLC